MFVVLDGIQKINESTNDKQNVIRFRILSEVLLFLY